MQRPATETMSAAQVTRLAGTPGAKPEANRAFLSTHKWKIKQTKLTAALLAGGANDLHIIVKKADKANTTGKVFFRDKYTLEQFILSDADADAMVATLPKMGLTFDTVMAAVKAHPNVRKVQRPVIVKATVVPKVRIAP